MPGEARVAGKHCGLCCDVGMHASGRASVFCIHVGPTVVSYRLSRIFRFPDWYSACNIVKIA